MAVSHIKIGFCVGIHRDLDWTVDFGSVRLGFRATAEDRGLGARVGVAVTRTDLSYDQRYDEFDSANAAGLANIGTFSGIIYP